MAKFSQEQVAQMREWIKQVRSVSEFQSKLNEAFNLHLTYLETRFLMDDLDLQIVSETTTKEETPEASTDKENTSDESERETT